MGQLGKKLHTGRSRNDQVATDLKLWCKDTVVELLSANRQLQSALVETAQQNQDAVMPGYTHLQRAQPVTFAHWCLAYVEMLARDESRLQDALKRLDVSPLGCGALAGTAYEIDREQLAGWLEKLPGTYPFTHERSLNGLRLNRFLHRYSQWQRRKPGPLRRASPCARRDYCYSQRDC